MRPDRADVVERQRQIQQQEYRRTIFHPNILPAPVIGM